MNTARVKSLLRQFAVTLVAIGLGLAAYDYFRHPDIAAARAQSQALQRQAQALMENSRDQTQALSQQAQALHNQATALGNEVSAEHRDAQLRKQQFMTASYRAEGLQVVGAAKVAIAEFFMTNGAFPSSNEQAGLAAPGQFSGLSLRNLRVSAGGIITMTYNAKSGVDGGIIRLIPIISDGAMLKWRCVSPNFQDIAVTIPQCSFVAPETPGTIAHQQPIQIAK